MIIDKSPTLMEYKDTLIKCVQMYMPVSREELEPIIEYSVNKRYYEAKCVVDNTYTKKKYNMTLGLHRARECPVKTRIEIELEEVQIWLNKNETTMRFSV